MSSIKGVIRSLKNEINNYDEGERLVRELTSNERTPPATEMLVKLKLMLNDSFQFQTVVRMLFTRLSDYNNIRHTEKSLICIEYLIKNADTKFVRYCQRDKGSISKLQRYRYMLGNHNGVQVDYGSNVRKRAKRIVALLETADKLKAQRAKAQGFSMKTSNRHAHNHSPIASTAPKRKAKKKRKKKTKAKAPAVDDVEEEEAAQPMDLLGGLDFVAASVPSGDDDEFGWFQAADAMAADAEHKADAGHDGGAFAFGDADDFADDAKEEDEAEMDVSGDPDAWMLQLTQMGNVLDGSIKKAEPNKRNQKGRSMASMATANSANSANSTSNQQTDAFFSANDTTDFDPFGLDAESKASNPITSLYTNKAQVSTSAAAVNTGFGYQGQPTANAYSAADPFAGIGKGNSGKGGGAHQPANYVPRTAVKDPFAQFGSVH